MELLGNRVSAAVSEAKIVGSKLIFKGVFHITVLYRTGSSLCCSSSAELPFSQIMEVEGAAEDHTADVQIQLTGTDLQLDSDDDEGRQIAVTLYFHATALLRQQQELTLLGDLYSTAYDMSYEAVPVSLTGFMETMTRRQTVREVLEIGVEAESVLTVSVCCGGVQVNREGENVTLRTGATVRVLYQDEGGTPLVAERCLDVSCQVELPESCKVTARAVCTEEVQTGIGDRGDRGALPGGLLHRGRNPDQAGVHLQRPGRYRQSPGHDGKAVPGFAVPRQTGECLGPGQGVQHHHPGSALSQSAGKRRGNSQREAAADPSEAGISRIQPDKQ